MIIFYKEHQEMLQGLIQHDVEFILVGGYAVNYHGYNRQTGDMDIWLKPTNSNKEKLVEFLKSIKINEEGIEKVKSLDFTKYFAFHFGKIPLQVDFFNTLQCLNFDESYNNALLLPFKQFFIKVLHVHDLILTKITSGRTKDKLDVEEFHKILLGKPPK